MRPFFSPFFHHSTGRFSVVMPFFFLLLFLQLTFLSVLAVLDPSASKNHHQRTRTHTQSPQTIREKSCHQM
ncbi:hypothetical protein BJ741DRAFT_608842 [Chytriomyces cf. hyalinus JEL632]|nr:hypothetical protein BJ741DRAFT_608842 [Chytriomyces cf. hyalinus JEL632]